jgi:hypothetical protein
MVVVIFGFGVDNTATSLIRMCDHPDSGELVRNSIESMCVTLPARTLLEGVSNNFAAQ